MSYHPGLSLDPDGGAPLVGVILANHALATFRNGALMPVSLPRFDKPIRRDDMGDLVIALNAGDVDGAIDAVMNAQGIWSLAEAR